MSARVSDRSPSQRSADPAFPHPRAAPALCAAAAALAAAWWAGAALPVAGSPPTAAAAAVLGALLCAALSATALLWAEAARARRRAAELERTLLAFAHEGVDLLWCDIQREGVRADEAVAAALERIGTADDTLRTLVRRVGAALGEGDRRGRCALAATAAAAARLQTGCTGLLALLRVLQDRYGDQDHVMADLFELDHRVCQAGRVADGIALLARGRTGRRWAAPITMESILRGAMGRIRDYRRVRIRSTGSAAVVGAAAEGVMQALAELMDNAAAFSPADTEVHVHVAERDTGVTVTVEDAGRGMRGRERRRAEQMVATPHDFTALTGARLGLAVAGAAAAEHGLRISFRPSALGGTGAVLLIPPHLVTTAPRYPLPAPSPHDGPVGAVPAPPRARVGDHRPVLEPAARAPLPRRRRGAALPAAGPVWPEPPAAPDDGEPGEPGRPGGDPAARFAAFRQAFGRGLGGPGPAAD
ncbi:ATP-binding protein [Streptomonospora nanhaiensis]|uniref:histidine kinase n=1 Tax=Streptomonospora nanhaiensis TaxID=1323731 RepID=A0A853BJK3_9ACTN|nr:ATP-binding protein [Streptomonospora nanhaiensis]MBV2363299.1 hypothetical protein [Streptomonospora nanhaiensis]NYI95659.1 signal transduction histidine kinase [Streptomonospora nanhaiensis]